MAQAPGGILYNEQMVGRNHPTLSDTLNRAVDSVWTTFLNEHKTTGDHKFPIAMLTATAAQSIANSTITALTFDNEIVDTNNWHDNVTNNSRIKVDQGGFYLFLTQLSFVSNSTGFRMVYFLANGTVEQGRVIVVPPSGAETRITTSTIYSLSPNDYVEVMVFQNSGAALNVANRIFTAFRVRGTNP
jgi:hypothetical protein